MLTWPLRSPFSLQTLNNKMTYYVCQDSNKECFKQLTSFPLVAIYYYSTYYIYCKHNKQKILLIFQEFLDVILLINCLKDFTF